MHGPLNVKNGTETADSTKCGVFLKWLRNYAFVIKDSAPWSYWVRDRVAHEMSCHWLCT